MPVKPSLSDEELSRLTDHLHFAVQQFFAAAGLSLVNQHLSTNFTELKLSNDEQIMSPFFFFFFNGEQTTLLDHVCQLHAQQCVHVFVCLCVYVCASAEKIIRLPFFVCTCFRFFWQCAVFSQPFSVFNVCYFSVCCFREEFS